MDAQDIAILKWLQQDGRMSLTELAKRVHLSAPAIHARIRKLEESGVVTGYVALLDSEKTGFDLCCFIHIGLQLHQAEHIEGVLELFQKLPQVLECYHVTGEYDYLLKVALKNRKELEALVSQLTPIPGIARIHTSVALSEIKNVPTLPLD